MKYTSRLISDPNVFPEKPVIQEAGFNAELILKKLAEGMKIDEIMEAYPKLSRENIMDVLANSDDVGVRDKVIASIHIDFNNQQYKEIR